VRGAGLVGPIALPGTNRRVARLAAWLVPAGPIVAGLLPDYRVPGLHVTFIGGFGLLALAVATHVTASHCEGLPEIRDGRATIMRVVARACSSLPPGAPRRDRELLEHLAAAAAIVDAATALWSARCAPRGFVPAECDVRTAAEPHRIVETGHPVDEESSDERAPASIKTPAGRLA
jgi:hypothetical protein